MSENFQPGPNCEYLEMCGRSCLAGSGIRSELNRAQKGKPNDLNSSLRRYNCQHEGASGARIEAQRFRGGQ